MKLLFAAALMLMLSSVALAAPDSQQVGPYTVSFDMNADYQVQISEPMETNDYTAYNMALVVDNSTGAGITIAEYAKPTDATLNLLSSLGAMSMALQGFNATNIEDITIGGREGFLITGEPFEAAAGVPNEFYKAMYWLDSEICECGPVSVGTSSVTITSTYPSDVTKELLSSLSVVKGEAAAAPVSGGQDMPPN